MVRKQYKTPKKQRDAMQEYRAKYGGAAALQKTVAATFNRAEGEAVAATIKAAKLTPAQIMRAAWYRLRHNPAEAEAIRQDAENARTEYAAQSTAAEHPADSPEE